MAKFKLITGSIWAGSNIEHDIEGDFKNEEEALKSIGGENIAERIMNEDQGPYWEVEKVEEEEEEEEN